MVKHGSVVAAGAVCTGGAPPGPCGAGPSRDILPRNSHSRLLSNTRIILGLVSGCLRFVRFTMQAACILSLTPRMGHGACCLRGWLRPGQQACAWLGER